MMTPVPPARVRATKPTRHSRASMPLYSARPPLTPPRILSVRLRRSCGRTGGPGGGGGGCHMGGSSGGGVGGGAGGGGGGDWAVVLRGGGRLSWREACRSAVQETIRERPHPTLVRPTLLFQGDHRC